MDYDLDTSAKVLSHVLLTTGGYLPSVYLLLDHWRMVVTQCKSLVSR